MCLLPVLFVCCGLTEAGMLALQSSSLMPVLPESTQITSRLLEFTSCCDAADVADDDARVVTSPGEKGTQVKLVLEEDLGTNEG